MTSNQPTTPSRAATPNRRMEGPGPLAHTDVEAVAARCAGLPDTTVRLTGSGRVVAADVDGDPDGVPVVLVHGTPDSRLARHPDPEIAAGLGVRLIAVDRPGFGHTSPDRGATPQHFAADLAALFDHLGLESVHLLAWSAGAIWALGAASELGERVRSVTAVGALVPGEAFNDTRVRAAAGSARLGMVTTAEELGATAAAALIAPMLVPDPATPAAALEHRAEVDGDDLEAVPGATVQMAAATCDAVRQGAGGLIRDLAVQFGASRTDLEKVASPVHLVTGGDDHVCPPAFADWYAAHLPDARVSIIEHAGHGLLLTHWRTILEAILA